MRVDESVFEYLYASHYKVNIPCDKYLPIASRVEITRVDGPTMKIKDDFPKLSNILLQAAKVLIHHSKPVSCKEVHRIASILREPSY
jgi:kinetochore protein Spc7/SPC105